MPDICSKQMDGSGTVSGDINDPGNSTTLVESRDCSQNVSERTPSSTVAILLIAQLQFLATLSLVEATATMDTWLSDFIVALR